MIEIVASCGKLHKTEVHQGVSQQTSKGPPSDVVQSTRIEVQKTMNRKSLFTTGLLATSLVAASSGMAVAQETEEKRIAFFVSDMTNVFHQNQATEAQRYGAEEYGADVVIFDGKADSAVMTQNVDQVLAGGFDGATLHIWDGEAATPGINDALAQDIAMTSFFSPIAETGIPTARSDEPSVSFEMGKQMAEQ